MSDMIETISRESMKGYTEFSGIELTQTKEGYAEGKVEIQDHHRNPSGAVHGGIIFCLGDVIGGIACRTLGALPVTVSSNISYMRPMLKDRVIYARAEVLKAGKTLYNVTIRILNEQKTESAVLQAIYHDMKSRGK
ncbi:MAG: PaaI family thioesterase [Parasporobacterium sp.]|nr:PaaI family thioesterase [Parasporobacterium sp.]